MDTSALVKRYINEAGSEQVSELFDQYRIVGASILTKAEMAAAMSKANRMGWVDEPEIVNAWQDFLSHWFAYARIPVSTGIIEGASLLAWQYGLRAYDSIQLATALSWKEMTGEQIVFASFDKSLSFAAQKEGLQVWP